MLELMITLTLAAILSAVYQSQQIIEKAEETLIYGVGEHLLRVQGGSIEYQRRFFAQLGALTPIAGVADILNPTIAELQALTVIDPGVKAVTATGQGIKIRVVRVGCPGPSCQTNALVYLDGTIKVSRTGSKPRVDLAPVLVAALKGAGGMSTHDAPGVIRGAGATFPNPLGTTIGIVGAYSNLNTAFYNAFVRMNDNRDPNLAGNFSVAGDGKFGGSLAVVGGATAASVASSGPISSETSLNVDDGAGCQRVTLSITGVAVKNAACATVATMDSAGRVTLGDGTRDRVVVDGATGAVSLKSTTGVDMVRLRQTGSGGAVQALNAAGTVLASMDGSTGLAQSRRGSFTQTGTEGSSCGAGVGEADVVSDADALGTLLVCRSGVWVKPGLANATVGSPCAPDGRLAQSPTGQALICRSGVYVTLTDRVARQVQMARYAVSDGSAVSKPSCGLGATQSIVVTPVDVVSDYSGTPPRNRYVAAASDVGGNWIVILRLLDGSGGQYTSSFGGVAYGMQGIATTFCDYAM